MDEYAPSGQSSQASAALAIVGFAFEFPGDATSPEKFWQMIQEGRSASSEFPEDRLNIDAYYHPDTSRPATLPVRGGHFVKEPIAAFDAPFFSISPGEAACMDPQHRRLLETTYHALEDAGISIDQCAGSDTSVYTGCFTNDYLSILQQDLESEQRHAVMGVAPSMLANRISWFFNLKGTSMNLDSACSSSLIALHLGCQDLRAGNCSMALVGGANLVYHPNFMKMMTDFNFLSKDSRSWSFDARANGYARGEGHAMLVVKRLDDALREGHTIRAVIRNTGSNQDGRTPGITQPSAEAQLELIRRTYNQAGLDFGPTRFFEAHGTGTPVGDPIEASAIGAAFHKYRSKDDPLHIGAVKATIGHLEGCSGLAGVIKTVMVLEKGVIPPIASFETINSKIDEEALHLRFPKQAVPWPVKTLRRACVNSFGFGGTNATVILDDAYNHLKTHRLSGFHQTRPGSGATQAGMEKVNGLNGNEDRKGSRLRLLVCSGTERNSSRDLLELYRGYLKRQPVDWDDLAFTLAQRRSHFSWRSFAVAGPKAIPPAPEDASFVGPIKALPGGPRIAFVFTGQGAQYLGMGRELKVFPVFLESLRSSGQFLKALGCSWSPVDIIFDEIMEHPVNSPEYSQPLVTCLQIGLVDLLKSFGVSPSAVLGHSSGEVAAAYACGALSHQAAVRVAYHRGRVSAHLAATTKDNELTMVAVGLSREEVKTYLNRLHKDESCPPDIEIGCVNSPKSITLTGRWEALSKVEQWLNEDLRFARRLRVPVAYHSHFMGQVADEYRKSLSQTLEAGDCCQIPMVSSVTGDVLEPERLLDGEYWVRNLTSTVEFELALSKVAHPGNKKPRARLGKKNTAKDLLATHVLEIGPHSALQAPIRDCLEQFSGSSPRLTYISSLVRGRSADMALLEAVGALYCAGCLVDLLRVNGLENSARPAPPNMPAYPFNHSQLHWKEGRLSKNLRFPSVPRHDLLGSRSLDWNAQIAQWRNVIRLAEVPWLEHHTINGQIIFPAAGMIAMALESMMQIQGNRSTLIGLYVEEATFSHAIAFLRGADHIETQFTLSTPASTRKGRGVTPSEFRLFIIENGSYIECCSGTIRSVVDRHDRNQIVSSYSWPGTEDHSTWATDITRSGEGPVHNIYDNQGPEGIIYGPCFQNVKEFRPGFGGKATAQIATEAWKAKMPKHSSFPNYPIHPTTLDGLAQLLVPALSHTENTSGSLTMMPVHVDSLWIDCEGLDSQASELSAYGSFQMQGQRRAEGNVIATSSGSTSPVIIMSGLRTKVISNSKETPVKVLRPLCHRIIQKPDISMMSHDQVLAYCTSNRPNQDNEIISRQRIKILALLAFIKDALEFLDAHDSLPSEGHLQSYAGWMAYQLQLMLEGESPFSLDDLNTFLGDAELREARIQQITESDTEGLLLMTLGRNLAKILSGSADPLAIIFDNRLADRYYEEMLASDHHAYPVCEFVDLLSFKNPSMKILEVGAGTGGITTRLLEAMSQDGILKWSQYDFTDKFSGFFSLSKDKLEKYAHLMKFEVLDISNDPQAQGFESSSYDLIVASHVLHATQDIDVSLKNIRKLLKPDGKLLLIETTSPNVTQIGFIWGLLKDWWKPLEHETRSVHSPLLTADQWDHRLKRAGFSGVDVNIPGQADGTFRYSSIIISGIRCLKPKLPQNLPDIHLIVDRGISSQDCVAELMAPTCNVWSCEQFAQGETLVSTSMVTVFLVELDNILLDGIQADDFRHLQAALSRSKRVLWVTRSSGADDPRHHIVDGLGRVLMSEDSTYKFSTLHLDDSLESPERIVSRLLTVSTDLVERSVESVETNFTSQNGLECINRITENSLMNRVVADATSSHHDEEFRLGSDATIKLEPGYPSQGDTLRWKERALDEKEATAPGEEEVVVQVRAVGFTRKDYLATKGHGSHTSVGAEFSGTIVKAGARSGFTCGEPVLTIASSGCTNRLVVPARSVTRIPPHLGFNESAALPSALWLSYHSLVNVARLQPGETVLILHGSSCLGQVALQLAMRLGAEVLVTTSSHSKKDFLQQQYKLPRANILLGGDELSLRTILQRTQGQGVDVVVGSLSDGVDQLNFTTFVKPLGRIIDLSLDPSARIPRKANVLFISIQMDEFFKHQPRVAYETLRQAVAFASTQQLEPPHFLHVFQGSDIKKMFSHFGRENFGKRIVELQPNASVTASMIALPRSNFSKDATYVIAGGFGGLGRSLVRWMARQGARHLVILSRSGARTPEAVSLVHDLENMGTSVACPAVDISNLAMLRETIRGLSVDMPPIQGCIQATVALRDNFWPNMSFEDWHVSTSSKVTGSWNLHAALPQELDFFILLSSVNGIFGNRGQANYAAGNTFKDALAHYRISQGQKAVSIDLGLMVDEGMVAENEKILAGMRRIGHLIDINMEDLIALMEYYCDPKLPILSHADAQVLVGVELPSAVLAKGVELHHSIHRPIFRHLFAMGNAHPNSDSRTASSASLGINRLAAIRGASSDDEAAVLVTGWLKVKLTQMLGIALDDMDTKKPAHTYGIDSLIAMDLRNWFAREVGADMPVFVLLGNSPLEELCREAVGLSQFRQEHWEE